MDNRQALEAVARADDLQDLLSHIAWEATILPQLTKLKESYAKMLVDHLLGTPLPGTLTKEQIAGKIYGIDEITRLFKQILREGKRGFQILESEGIHVDLQ